MSMELINDLANRLARLDRSWRVMCGMAAGDGTAAMDHLAVRWADRLRTDDQHAAEAAADQVRNFLVTDAEASASAFWSTELGRCLARYGHAPVNAGGQVPAATVGAILGFTRSRASDLQGRGRLCTPSQVAAALREREGAA